MIRTMEILSDGSEDDFHSASDSPMLHGDLGPSAALLAVQLALVCVRLHQRARTQNTISGAPLHPVGLPPLKKSRNRYAEAIIEGNLQRSSDGFHKPSVRVSSERGYKQLWSDSRSSSTDEGYGYALRQRHSKKVVQGLEAAQNGEDLACFSNLCQDRGSSSCISNQRAVDDEDDDNDTLGKKFKQIVDLDNLTVRELSDDLQQSSISSVDLFNPRSHKAVFTVQDKGGPWSSGIELDTSDDRSFDTERDDLYDSSQANNVFNNGAMIPNSKALLCSEREGAPGNGGPEEGQFNSFLLWPVGLAVEAIAFQVRLIAQAFSLVAILYDWCNSFASSRVRKTWQAKERATEVLSQKVAMISNVPPKVTESGSMVLKRAGWGCFAALYVCILLSMLLFPTVLLDYVFLSKIVEYPVNVQEPLHFDYTLPHPSAVVYLHPLGGKLGIHSERARPIPVSRKVLITVLLTLPESDYNRELGMFQLSAELLTETGGIVKSSSRPCMLRFHSFPIRMLKTFLISLPSLVGMFTESQTLVVHLMEFEEQRVATRGVRIVVQPKAGMPLGQGIPEIYSAYVHIESHLPWLKNMMRKWKWTIYIWTGLTLYVVEIIMILCCCRQALVPKAWVGQNDEIKADQIGSVNAIEVDESSQSRNQSRKERVPSRHHSLHEHIPIARAVLLKQESKLSQVGHMDM